jgi:asparagine synthase (glutamine-hydrolysing)
VSAIAGIIGLNGAPVPTGHLERLTRAMAPRGPDGVAHWRDGTAELGLCLLLNTPESRAAQQPLLGNDGKLVLVFDGRLDNREELIRSLAPAVLASDTPSDAEIVLAAFHRWAEACPGRMLGDFAFAVWDRRQSRLFCARDCVGARTFYHACNDRYFAFASDDAALIHLPEVRKQPSEDLIAYYFVWQVEDIAPEQAWLEDVSALLPAHSMTVTRRGMEPPTRYWRHEPGAQTRFASDSEYVDAFADVFGQAVRSRMRIAGEPAAIISGGMDSAALAVAMRSGLAGADADRYHAYSMVADPGVDSLESRSIISIAGPEHAHPHRSLVPSLSGVVSIGDVRDIAWSRVHPQGGSILTTASMCLAAGRNRHRVLLHAPSGDLTIGNFPGYVADLLKQRDWRRAWHESRSASRNNTYLRDKQPWEILLRSAWAAFVPPGARRRVRRLRAGAYQEPDEIRLLNRDFARRLDISERVRREYQRSLEAREDEFRQSQVDYALGPAGIVTGLASSQRAASHYGVELSDPWADRRVIEFFAGLPLDQRIRDGWTKYLVRAACAPYLEPWVCWRNDKEHLGWMLRRRLMQESRDLIEHAMHADLEFAGDYVDVGAARRVYGEFKAVNSDESRQFIYDLVTLILWLKQLSAQS